MDMPEPPPLRLEYRDPATLSPNPRNWRRHPPAQAHALKAALAEVGWAGALLYNETTGCLIDGHLRRDTAEGEQVPVLIGAWTEEQERLILATLDPLGAMAQADGDALIELLGSLDVQDRSLADMLEALANGERQPMPEHEPSPVNADAGQAAAAMATALERWAVRHGDCWEAGRQRLLCADSADPAAVAMVTGGQKPMLLLTDPPYCSGGWQEANRGAGTTARTGNVWHYTEKPVKLLRRILEADAAARPGALVYDPFVGSGSTLLAAEACGRAGCGIDVEPACIAVALERLSQAGLTPVRMPEL